MKSANSYAILWLIVFIILILRDKSMATFASATVADCENFRNTQSMKKKNDKLNGSIDTLIKSFDSCGWYMRVLGTCLDTMMNERLKPLGLSLSQFAIVMTLHEEDGLTQIEIGQKVMLPAYTTSRQIDKLESLGYVKRSSHSSSRRCHRVVLTDDGKNLAPALFAASKSVNDQFLSPLTDAQKAELMELLGLLTSKWAEH